MTRPAVTAASTPDSPSRSAGRYAANGITSEITTSTGGSSSRRRTWLGDPADDHADRDPAHGRDHERAERRRERRTSPLTAADDRRPVRDQRASRR